jgi:hypothetical protein
VKDGKVASAILELAQVATSSTAQPPHCQTAAKVGLGVLKITSVRRTV